MERELQDTDVKSELLEITTEEVAKEYAKVWAAVCGVILINIGVLLGVVGILGYITLTQAALALALLVFSGMVELVPSTTDMSKHGKETEKSNEAA